LTQTIQNARIVKLIVYPLVKSVRLVMLVHF